MRKEKGFAGQRTCSLSPELVNVVLAHPHCQGLYITDIGYYPSSRFHYRERLKGSQECILIYCTEGAGWYRLGGKKYDVGPNQAFILPARTPHQYGADLADPWSIYWVHFAGAQAGEFQRYLHQAGQSALDVIPNEERFQLFDDIFTHLTMVFNPDNVLYSASCLPHFLATFRESVYKQAVQDKSDDRVSLSISFMKQHLSQPLTLHRLAQHMGMSLSHYSALFRQQTQSSPIQFFNFLRMQQACLLLENTSLRVKEISFQLGFDDPYHFSRVFRHFIGHSPRQYRATEKGEHQKVWDSRG